ncbi:hypothetical protein HDU81_003323 [Chytriomyces hyalinus]|nr:hypothetical protein HDU81_003323 [Chytriomyces hyalinus]
MSQAVSENQQTSNADIELDYECERDDSIQPSSEAEIHAELQAMLNELGVSVKVQQKFMAHSSIPKSLLLDEWAKTRAMMLRLTRLKDYAWLREFLDAGGLGHIAGVIDPIIMRPNKNGQKWDVFVSAVKCLNELAKTADGAEAFEEAAGMVSRVTYAILKRQSAFEENAAIPSSIRVDTVFAKTATQAPIHARIAVFKFLKTLCTYGTERGRMIVLQSLNEVNESGSTQTQEIVRTPILQSWTTEFECVVDECVRHWGGLRDKTARIFSHLADGTYRWQPIVYAKAPFFPTVPLISAGRAVAVTSFGNGFGVCGFSFVAAGNADFQDSAGNCCIAYL